MENDHNECGPNNSLVPEDRDERWRNLFAELFDQFDQKAAEANRLKDEKHQLQQELDEIYADSTVELCASCNSKAKQSDQPVQRLESKLKTLLINSNETANSTLETESTDDLNDCRYIEREENGSPLTSFDESNQIAANTPEKELEMLREQTKKMAKRIKADAATINDLYADICEMGNEIKQSNLRQNQMKEEITNKTREFHQLKVQNWQLEIQFAHLCAQKSGDLAQPMSGVEWWNPTANLFQPSPTKRPKLTSNQILLSDETPTSSKLKNYWKDALKHGDSKKEDKPTNSPTSSNATMSTFSFDYVPMHKPFEFDIEKPKDDEPHPPCASELVNIEEMKEMASVSSQFINAFRETFGLFKKPNELTGVSAACSNNSSSNSSNGSANKPRFSNQQSDYNFMNLSTTTALSFSSDDTSDEFGPLVSAKSFSSSTGSWEKLDVELAEN
ncbi:hypothetical protein M3Y95_00965000 [Aphelenchoides besseyi]|nr:hypothetical protein M3Y95_00965000 [Aphelenchoides besseyi]